ncbi:MAG: NADH-quinone oxidoreductase subunit J [Vicinamibacteria bacterium]|nr:NADH-quinone oxidoreductase subunit J [Vicinamibacteria bacterium]
MTAEIIIFYSLAVLTVGSAAVVVLARHLIYNVFALLFTFLGVAGLYLTLGADFLAAAQLLIYVGGILVLLIFGVMLTQRIGDLRIRSAATRFGPSAFGAALLFGLLLRLALRTTWKPGPGRAPAATTAEIGREFLTTFLLPFEAASILLVVALLGAALIVRRKKDA